MDQKIVDESIKKVLIQRNKLLTEAVIAAWMDTHNAHETAEILREFADQLVEHL